MAQYTPNFNLYEPDTTDDFADFRTEFNNNMDIIDQNLGGGGGSGGHTIYDKDGNALAQESGLQFTGNVNVSDDNINGRTVVDITGGGGSNLILDAKIYSDNEKVVGVWRDNKPLYQKTIYTNNATVNNEVAISVSSLNVDSLVDIKGTYDRIVNWLSPPLHMVYCFDVYEGNDEQSFIRYDVDDENIKYRIKLANNEATSYQAITIQYTKTTDVAGSGGYEAYGFSPVIYSDVERCIGVWRDNKPLYQRTFVYTPSATISTTTAITTLSSDIEVKDVKGVAVNTQNNRVLPLCYSGNNFGTNFATSASNDLQIEIYNDTWGTNYTFLATVQYTKTTDVAGSGDYNTYGVPTVHYSTSEQVIGTWTNGKPCYEITLEGSGSYVSNIEHIISIPLNADNVRIMSGFVDIGTDWLPISLTLGLGTGSTNGIYCYPNKSDGLHLFSSAWTFTKYSIVIQYTKTTD